MLLTKVWSFFADRFASDFSFLEGSEVMHWIPKRIEWPYVLGTVVGLLTWLLYGTTDSSSLWPWFLVGGLALAAGVVFYLLERLPHRTS